VTIGQPLGAEAPVAASTGDRQGQESQAGNQTETELEFVPEPVASSGGANGIYGPGGSIAGVVSVQGVASLPDFWKWQLDILVDGQTPSFVAVGEQPVPSPGSLVALNTANYPNGEHVLRLRVVHSDGNYEEYYSRVTIAN
jgi:hypothetical protein